MNNAVYVFSSLNGYITISIIVKLLYLIKEFIYKFLLFCYNYYRGVYMKKILYGILIITILLFTGCSNNIELKETEGEYFSKLYEGINKENPYKRINAKDAVDMVQNGTGILYLGYTTCPWCKQIVTVLNDAAKENNINSIYYIEKFYEMRPDKNSIPKNIEEYNKLLELLDDIIPFEKDENGNNTKLKIIRVPLILFIKNGEIVDYHSGTYEGHNLMTKIDENGNEVKYLEDLTSEQRKNIKKILSDKINKIYDKNCNNGC